MIGGDLGASYRVAEPPVQAVKLNKTEEEGQEDDAETLDTKKPNPAVANAGKK
jgi:hypothetical protein